MPAASPLIRSQKVKPGLVVACCWSWVIQLRNMSLAPELDPMKLATALNDPFTSRKTDAQLAMIMATTRYLIAVTASACRSPPRNAAW